MDDRIFVGVCRLVLLIPGARSLKDRRQAVASVRDRIAHRFPVSVHEVDTADLVNRQTLVVTTAGNDAAVLRSNLDKIASFVRSNGNVLLSGVDADVFRWHAPDDPFASLEIERSGHLPDEPE